MGHNVPNEKIKNDFFESLEIGTTADWIKQRTGITSRHSVLSKSQIKAISLGKITALELMQANKLQSIANLSQASWQQLTSQKLRSGQTQACDVVICGTSVPDYDIPANASQIAKSLDLVKPICLDVNTACSSFVSNLAVAKALLESTTQKKIAIFNVERYSIKLDYRNRESCILFGDGATACLVESGKDLKGLQLIDVMLESDPSMSHQVMIPYGGLFSQKGRVVQKFAIHRTCEMTREILTKHKLETSDVNYFIGHQANLRMLQSATRHLGFKAEQHLYNVDRYGNQGAAGAPSVLSENWSSFQVGDYVVLTVVGAGLTWGAALFQFC